jgi:alpha-tubulin suppressor-like RCC1 family protein
VTSRLVLLAVLSVASVALAACQTIDQHGAPGLGDNLAGGSGSGGGNDTPAQHDGGGSSDDTGATAAIDAASVPDAGPATLVATGYEHSCALSQAGAVLCWGANEHGQLGNGSNVASSAIPVAVQGLTGGVTALAAGTDHTCALVQQDGGSQVLCWGRNDHGQLGDGTTVDRPAPVVVPISQAITVLAAGGYHTCAGGSGGAWCWGQGDSGQLGNGTTTDSPAPVAVSGLASAAAITAGGAHSCAIDGSGGVWCWGEGGNGQLGADSTTNSPLAVAVTGLGGAATAVGAGNAHTCATTAGGVMCWGYGQYGQLGNGSTADSPVPVQVSMIGPEPKGISAGAEQSCALDARGGAWCWGDDQSGQLGDNGSSDQSLPVAVQGITAGASCISGGAAHTCAVVAGGGVQCWGWNVSGQLGNGTQSDSPTAAPVAGF